jgi:molecular chaperone GrpE
VQKDTEQEVDDVTKKKPTPPQAAAEDRQGSDGAAPERETADTAAAPTGPAVAADGAPIAGEPAAAEVAGDDDAPAEPAEEVRSTAEQAQVIVADLAGVRAEAAGYLNDLRRLQAEFDNYRKRMLREQTARIASASQALVARLLPVVDNFERAISHAEQSPEFDRSMLKGVEMVYGQLQEVLRGEGLSRIEAEGKPFDPERHEAVVAVEQEGAEPGTVVAVERAGYELQGKVLRPALVRVAR